MGTRAAKANRAMKPSIPAIVSLSVAGFCALAASHAIAASRGYLEIEAQVRQVTQPGKGGFGKGQIPRDVRDDQNHLSSFQTSKDGPGLLSAIEELETKWRTGPLDGYVQVMAAATIAVQKWSGYPAYWRSEPNLEQVIQYHASNVLRRLPLVSLETAGRAMRQLAADVGGNCGENQRTALDRIGRDAALIPFLELLNRIETLMAIPANSGSIGFTRAERDDFESGFDPESIGGVPVPASERSDRFGRLREFLHCREIFGSGGDPQKVTDGWTGWQGVLETRFTTFVQRHYTESEADLDEVQQAFDKCLTAPGLKERIILAAYRGTNPFVGRQLSSSAKKAPSDSVSIAELQNASREPIPGVIKAEVPATPPPAKPPNSGVATRTQRIDVATRSTSPHRLPYIRLAGVLATGLALWWFISRSRGG